MKRLPSRLRTPSWGTTFWTPALEAREQESEGPLPQSQRDGVGVRPREFSEPFSPHSQNSGTDWAATDRLEE